MYNYPYYFQNMQQCNLNSSQFYRLQSQNVNCAQRFNDGCTNVAFNLQQQIVEVAEKGYKNFPKSCYNCKHKRYGYHNVTDGPCDMWGGLDSYDYARICIRSGYTFWESEFEEKFNETSAQLEDLQFKIKIEELKLRIEQFESQRLQTNIAVTPKITQNPEKKYTVYDMYDLVFPDDPIKAHFDAERKKINEEYEKQKAVVDKLEVPEVRINRPEPIPTVTYDDSLDLLDAMLMALAGILIGVVFVSVCA